MTTQDMWIDIETYSSVDLTKSGLYKYVQAPDFTILLFGYAFGDGQAQVIDLTEQPLPARIKDALLDPAWTKHAHNAAFEWQCLSRYLEVLDPVGWLPQWRDTLLQVAYCGYPGSLDAAGEALGLAGDQRKDRAGKALIRYFSMPCKPTKSNGGRTRNLPGHAPDKWALYKAYNAQDVVTERAIAAKLAAHPVPEAVQAQWVSDLTINARGVAVDLDLVRGALDCGERVKRALTQEAVALTGLDNPNSVAQLTAWLADETQADVDNLRRDTVTDLLAGDLPSDQARRVLEIRQELGRTSTKKYDAMARATCDDGRIRGTLQFYGANRTGRWAGRLLQVQNLPRTHLQGIDAAREMVKGREVEALRWAYGSVPDTLSQLIRTALVAAPGCTLVDADFSAIEARVIAWLAGEQWVLDVFRGHGRIYEAAAAQMFGVPIERIRKGNPEYELRQRGKVATLALGYQGGTGALEAMGALRMGIPKADLPDIVQRWRQANPAIVQLWRALDGAAVETVERGTRSYVRGQLMLAREYDPAAGLDFLTIQLPSGRKLYYAHPSLSQNRWGGPSIQYLGVDQQTRRWTTQETYGGKLAENCVQAIARDCLAEAIERLERAGYPIVFHVHDELVCETPRERADLDAVARLMSEPIPWAPGLPLAADGWVGGYYTKE